MEDIKLKNKSHFFMALAIFALLMIIVIGLSDRREILDYSSIKAAGMKNLTPTDIKQTVSKTRYKGRTTTHLTNYVKLRVEIDGELKEFWMRTSEAYGENSPSAGIEAVRKKKKIERYIFYTDERIYYSKEAATVDEYIKESIISKLIALVIAILLFVTVMLFIYFLQSISSKFKYRSKEKVM